MPYNSVETRSQADLFWSAAARTLLQPVNVTLIREGLRMTSPRLALISKGSRLPVPMGPLRALQQIERGTEDRHRDYLAHLVFEQSVIV